MMQVKLARNNKKKKKLAETELKQRCVFDSCGGRDTKKAPSVHFHMITITSHTQHRTVIPTTRKPTTIPKLPKRFHSLFSIIPRRGSRPRTADRNTHQVPWLSPMSKAWHLDGPSSGLNDVTTQRGATPEIPDKGPSQPQQPQLTLPVSFLDRWSCDAF